MLNHKWRSAIGSCKSILGLEEHFHDKFLSTEDKGNMEKCLTENFLAKYGDNYFGKRDLLYIDMKSPSDL
jgi:hypothetical protein